MTTRSLAHSVPLRPVIVTINIDVTDVFWPLFALVWLAWLMLTGLGRRVRAWGSWWAAAGRVIRRRFRAWKSRQTWRYSWRLMPVLGVG